MESTAARLVPNGMAGDARDHRRRTLRKRGSASLSAARWLVAPAILLWSGAAAAHPAAGETGLISGLLHPLFGLDHLLAMISVGVVSAQLGGRNVWRIPAAFVGMMTLGAVLGMRQGAFAPAEIGIAASVLVLGIGIVVAHRRMPHWPVTALVMMFGAFHGHAHGVELPQAASPALYTLGFVITTAVLHVFGVIIGEVAAKQAWVWKSLRLTGAALAASGVAFVLQALSAAA